MLIRLGWPSKDMSPNSRCHWRRKASAVKSARREAYYATLAAGRIDLPAEGLIAVRLTFHPPGNYGFDHDGLLSRCKASLDGIADALKTDDNRFRPSITIGSTMKGGCVLVEINE